MDESEDFSVSYPDDPTKLVRHLLVRLSYIFQSQLIMGDEKSIDEIMIGYFGKKCSQTFFIPRKPSKQKNGHKLHGIADANCGYLWSMFMQPRGRDLSPNFAVSAHQLECIIILYISSLVYMKEWLVRIFMRTNGIPLLSRLNVV